MRFDHMRRFYFHLHNDVDVEDVEGQELADIDSARLQAQELERFEAAEAVKHRSHLVVDHRIDIADNQGRILESVRFGDVIRVES